GARERNGASIINSISSNVLIAPGLTDDRSEATLLSTFKPRLPSGQPATALDASALALLNATVPRGQFLIPTPQLNGHYSGSAVSRFQEDQGNVKIDYHLLPSNFLSATAFIANSTQYLVLPGFRGTGPNLPGFGSDDTLNHRLITVQDIHSFSSTIINEMRLGYSFNRNDTHPEEPILDSDVGIHRSNAAHFPGLAMIRIAPGTGSAIIGSTPAGEGRRAASTTTFADTVSVVRGPHALRTGAEFRYNLINFATPGSPRGQIDFQS